MERATVGALLLASPIYAARILAAVQDSDFADPRCRFVASVVRAMHAEGVSVDLMTVTAHIQNRGLLSAGAPRIALGVWLHDTADLAPVPASGTWYARAVVECFARRRADAAADSIARAAVGASLDELDEIVSTEAAAVAAAIGRAR